MARSQQWLKWSETNPSTRMALSSFLRHHLVALSLCYCTFHVVERMLRGWYSRSWSLARGALAVLWGRDIAVRLLYTAISMYVRRLCRCMFSIYAAGRVCSTAKVNCGILRAVKNIHQTAYLPLRYQGPSTIHPPNTPARLSSILLITAQVPRLSCTRPGFLFLLPRQSFLQGKNEEEPRPRSRSRQAPQRAMRDVQKSQEPSFPVPPRA